jgi:hypothetical protein
MAWFEYTFSSTHTPPPTSSQLRLNNDDVAATALYVRLITNDGIDAYYALMRIEVGSQVVVQDKNDHQLAYEYRTTGAPIDQTTHIEVPLVGVRAAGSQLLNNQAVLLVVNAPVTTPTPPDSGGSTSPGAPIYAPGPQAPLVTDTDALAELKLATPLAAEDQLKLTTTIAAASASIRNYLKSATDPAWDATSCPPLVKAAVLLSVVNLWGARGDLTDAETSDAATARQIARLLMQIRDPALA